MTPSYERALMRGLFAVAAIALPLDAAHAYVGPGLGLGSLAVLLGIIGSVFLAIFAVVWYPIKRLMKKRKASTEAKEPPAED